MAQLKMYRGTPTNDTPHGLCGTCVHGHIRRDVNNNEIVRCDETRPSSAIRYPITECSDYQDKSETSLYEYKQIAWMIDVNSKTGKIGFEKPKSEDYREY
jgi:hypothetical protein